LSHGWLFGELPTTSIFAFTFARLTVLDWLAGPRPETATDRAIREEGVRKTFPEIDFDYPNPRRGGDL
jgi:hypothetical protein